MNETQAELELLERIASGDRNALAELYDRYERLVYSVAYRIVTDAQTSEEIVQDVFTKVWQKSHAYDPSQGKFSTWLLTVARNRALDVLKTRRRRQQETVQEDAILQTVPDPSLQPEQQVLNTLETETIQSALQELNADQRDVIEWMYYKGLSQQEITERYQIPLGTVKSRARLALQRLKQSLSTMRKEGRADDHKPPDLLRRR